MSGGLTIGEFARLTHLSVRTLRRYHESGLLEPARVDPASGYRYYASDQIPTAQVIHRLRELDVPLADVAKILATEDAEERAGLVGEHLRRLRAELDRTRAAVVSLRNLLRPGDGGLRVELRAVAASGLLRRLGFRRHSQAGQRIHRPVDVSPTSDIEFLVEDSVVGQGALPNAGAGTGGGTTWLMSTVVFEHA